MRRVWASLTLDRTSVLSESVLLVASTAAGASRDFGVFLIVLFILPCLALLTLVWIAAATLAPVRRVTWLGIAMALTASSVPAFPIAAVARDRVRFVGWAFANRPLARLARQDGVLVWWDSWGMAGSENDSYLVADPSDAIGTTAAAERWRRRVHLTCEIVDSQRMAARVYLVTTYNCPFSYDGHHWS